VAIVCTLVAQQAAGQSVEDYEEFYIHVRFDALDNIVLCSAVDSVLYEPLAYGVRRDSARRPIELARFRFGNIDNFTPYAITRITYDTDGDAVVERRTFHLSNGAPAAVGKISMVELLRRPSAGIVIRSLLNRKGEPVDDSAWTSRAYIARGEDGVYSQQWFISTGKQQKGTGSDSPLAPFGDMPAGAWFRRFALDDRGRLRWEQVYGIDKKPIPFPGGEMIRAYERDSCGMVTRVRLLRDASTPTTDSDGVHAISSTYDRRGNLVEQSFYDIDGRPRSRTSTRAARVVYIRRSFDNALIRTDLYDAAGMPVKTP